jgi:hypothetical protein
MIACNLSNHDRVKVVSAANINGSLQEAPRRRWPLLLAPAIPALCRPLPRWRRQSNTRHLILIVADASAAIDFSSTHSRARCRA